MPSALHVLFHFILSSQPPYEADTITSLAGEWLRLRASMAGGAGSIPGQGAKIPHAMQHTKKWKGKKKKKRN